MTSDDSAASSSHHGPIIGQHQLAKGYQGYAVNTLEDECCPPVVDFITLGTLLAGIAAATLLLRQLAIDNIAKKKKRSASSSRFIHLASSG